MKTKAAEVKNFIGFPSGSLASVGGSLNRGATASRLFLVRVGTTSRHERPTKASARGFSRSLMDVSRHKSIDTLRGYVRDAKLFKDHAGAGLL